MQKIVYAFMLLALIAVVLGCSDTPAPQPDKILVIEYANGDMEQYVLEPSRSCWIDNGGTFSSRANSVLCFSSVCGDDYASYRIVLSPGDKFYVRKLEGYDDSA